MYTCIFEVIIIGKNVSYVCALRLPMWQCHCTREFTATVIAQNHASQNHNTDCGGANKAPPPHQQRSYWQWMSSEAQRITFLRDLTAEKLLAEDVPTHRHTQAALTGIFGFYKLVSTWSWKWKVGGRFGGGHGEGELLPLMVKAHGMCVWDFQTIRKAKSNSDSYLRNNWKYKFEHWLSNYKLLYVC